jgi:hypothetical protein
MLIYSATVGVGLLGCNAVGLVVTYERFRVTYCLYLQG